MGVDRPTPGLLATIVMRREGVTLETIESQHTYAFERPDGTIRAMTLPEAGRSQDHVAFSDIHGLSSFRGYGLDFRSAS